MGPDSCQGTVNVLNDSDCGMCREAEEATEYNLLGLGRAGMCGMLNAAAFLLCTRLVALRCISMSYTFHFFTPETFHKT